MGSAATTTFQYDLNTGLLASTTDPNSNMTSYNFDVLGRPTQVVYPSGGGSETYFYVDSEPALSVTYTRQLSDTTNYVEVATLDGLGRKITDQVTSDPINPLTTDTSYDYDGRVWTVSNPYYSKSDPSYGITTMNYDVFGRPLLVLHPDGSSKQFKYIGSVTDSTDENNIVVRSKVNALGQLSDVYEDQQGVNLHTQYTYDALSNLKNVAQIGVKGEIARSRSFLYDSLSRLSSAMNPETGAVCYGQGDGTLTGCQANGYDGNGNLLYKTDSRGVVASYSYDPLNRLISKSHTVAGNLVGLSSCFAYDSFGSSGNTNSVGRRVAEWTQSGPCPASVSGLPPNSQSYELFNTYDGNGRLTSTQSCSLAPCTTSTLSNVIYTFNLAGSETGTNSGIVSGSSLASGLLWATTIDAAGRPSKVTSSLSDSLHPDILFQANDQTQAVLAAPYGPFGLTAAQYGLFSSNQGGASVLSELRSYDVREHLVSKVINGSLSPLLPPPPPPPLPQNPVLHMPTTVSFGETVIVTLTVQCSSNCGSAGISVDGQYVSGNAVGDDGTASFLLQTTRFSVGNHQLTGTYGAEGSSNALYPDPINFTIVNTQAAINIPVVMTMLNTDPTAGPLLVTANKSYTDGGITGYWCLDGQERQYFYAQGNDTQSLTLPAGIASGAHQLDVVYTGTNTYATSSARMEFTVGPASPTVTISPFEVHANGTPQITFAVNCATQCGSLGYTIDGTYIQGSQVFDGGTMQFLPSMGGFAVGNHNIQFSYGASPTTPSATPAVLVFETITPAAIQRAVQITTSAATIAAGQSATITASPGYYNGPTDGQFTIDGNYAEGFPIFDNPSCTQILQLPTNLSVGRHVIGAGYGGTPSFQTSYGEVTVNVQ